MDERKSLVLAAQHGDLDAFTLLVKQFQDMAFAVAYAILGDRCLAEDAAQEGFLEAYLNLRKLQEPAAFPGWLRTIVVRQAHRLARGKRVAVLPLEAAMEILSTESDPATAMLTRELHDGVYAAIQMLPEHERQVAMLFYISDCSQREIAEFLAVCVSTVKNRLFAARNHLRKRMIDMAQEYLKEQRLSNDDLFVTEVMEMIKATEQGDLAKIEALLAKRPALAKAKDPTAGATALHYASWTGQHEVAVQLLAHGADIDLHDDKHDASPIGWAGENGQQAESGLTPLHRAAWKRSADIVTLLLQHKAEANRKDSYGHTPMHLASTREGATMDGWGEAEAPDPKIIQALKEYGAT